jgi:hypothetical protein
LLRNKSLTELRAIYQGYGGGKDIFTLSIDQLRQEIEAKQRGMVPKEVIDIPRPEYDARLMDKPPSKKSSIQELNDLMKPYIERGLHFHTDHESWFMSLGDKNDQGTLRMPLRSVLDCADKIMRGSRSVTVSDMEERGLRIKRRKGELQYYHEGQQITEDRMMEILGE